jgi:hypothetical protein
MNKGLRGRGGRNENLVVGRREEEGGGGEKGKNLSLEADRPNNDRNKWEKK